MKLIALGEKRIENPEEAAVLCKASLLSISPSMVFSDFDNGWGLIVAQEAIRIGIPIMAVMPHGEVVGNKAFRHERRRALAYASTKVVFADDYLSFLRNPKPYAEWVLRSTDMGLCYINVERSSVSHSLMLSLRQMGKQAHNLHRSHS